MALRDKFWVWGYTMEMVPDKVSFVPDTVHCSLETAVKYLGLDHAVLMNSYIWEKFKEKEGSFVPNHNGMKLLGDSKGVICGLTGHPNWMKEHAAVIGKMSLDYPNIKGAIIDDFLDLGNANEKLTPGDLAKVYDALKSKNPDLKLYVVRYTWQKQEVIRPYLPYFDVINLWVWVSTENFWRGEYGSYINYMQRDFGKEILQGIFVHNYGETWHDSHEPVPPPMIELICNKVFPLVRSGKLAGTVFLQNGWFAYPNHKRTILTLKENLDWFLGVSTEPR